ncbi:hypothetical protein QTH87_12835 [Variovorax sp. J22P168]|uniref:hypothetical protein n=1 Tax=Variovorax jilinensis TaxID=3053513 RepID=UPI0025783CE2|nr:hypothetical protein [Variovorax sp. J22P168]MDM0013322.1 hypothetical protein [Variovorax sp. J22P168]
MSRARHLRPLALLLAMTGFAGVAAAAGNAEFALRWDPAEGGPASLEQIAEVLGVPATGRRKSFEVRYFTIEGPADAPEGASAIARERVTDGQLLAMYKLRSATSFDKRTATAWRCPLGKGAKAKNEVDVGWNADGTPRTSHSLSCETAGRIDKLLPASFKAQALGCTSTVMRVTTGGLKIESWSLPGGRLAFEVSANGKDTAGQLKGFDQRVVQPLRARGARPLAQSKTELGSSC